MKLLPKSAVDKAKVLDRQREIDEGKKLASRVDTLRELAAEEEQSLIRYREKTVALVQAEIDELIHIKQGLGSEIHAQRNTLAALMVPIDLVREEADKLLAEAKERMAACEAREFQAQMRDNWLLEVEQRTTKREAAVEALEISLSGRERSVIAQEEAIHTGKLELAVAIEKHTVESASKDKDLAKRTTDVAYRELDVDTRQRNLEARERKVQEDEIAIKDKYAALAQAIKHVNK